MEKFIAKFIKREGKLPIFSISVSFMTYVHSNKPIDFYAIEALKSKCSVIDDDFKLLSITEKG